MEFLDAIKNPLHRSVLLINSVWLITNFVMKQGEKVNVVENECHVMFYRILYDKLGDKFFNEITEKYNFFKDLNERSKLLFLFLKQY